MLKDIALDYYMNNNYNCAETIIRAANDYYGLGLHDRDMLLVGGFGGGMQTGNTCGAILSTISVLSMKYIEAKAHESDDIKPVTMLLTRKFNAKLGSTVCCEIKPRFFDKEYRCRNTILAACEVLEETIAQYEEEKAAPKAE